MKITILSGKGGTGKTTVATNLALSLNNAQFLDADVEEPNSYIFVKPNFADRKELVWREVPKIDQEKCTNCQECVEFCEYNALASFGNDLMVFPELCHSCGGCKHICPEGAIIEDNKEAGQIKWTPDVNGLEFWQGELNIGEISAVPVIEQLKEHINEEKTVIMDAPPGTTCPTVEAAIDSDYCIIVTEPTPFGLHDLKMAVEVVKKLDKPYGVIINRSENDANQIIEDYCTAEDIPILLRIPFKRQIAELYSEGFPFIEELPEWQERFKEVLGEIEKVIE
ncbi:ATP-binding protein [Sporohalobacter salinus]|uniref:ATP-binding protein n=1 Tax=Sporohalobacter salinus TaxID=1494606 RepID=UPI00196136E0|nr:ATP-binding protein [Sporohalobacter salinus]MBM7622697.1 MinD superfamily P-loop ATPase [Sporohalobacter salinus]